MESEKKGLSGSEQGESSEKLLESLKEQLHSPNGSIRRQSAFNLSWMQEDGLDILKGVLLSNAPVRTKNAAAYGLRRMRGRMKKMALDVLKGGLQDGNRSTREVCEHALGLMGVGNRKPPPKKKKARRRIEDIPGKSKPRRRITVQHTNPRFE